MADLTWIAELAEALVVKPATVLAALGPLDASVAAAHLEHRPDLAAEVRALALVESRASSPIPALRAGRPAYPTRYTFPCP